jgi:shikimate dehydrogenase
MMIKAREPGHPDPGLEMFLNQAVLQFETWTGKPAPTEVIRSVLEKSF